MMADNKLLEHVGKLGYPLFAVEEPFDVNQTLAQVVQSADQRLLEGFPVLLANAGQKGEFDQAAAEHFLSSEEDRALFREMVWLSLGLYKYFQLHMDWVKPGLMKENKVNQYKNNLAHDSNTVLAARQVFSAERLKRVFTDYYFSREARDVQKETERHADMSFEFALSQLFSPKQKQLFLKKLRGENLTKTEREYFSRTVKKKVMALANPDVNRFAKSLLGG